VTLAAPAPAPIQAPIQAANPTPILQPNTPEPPVEPALASLATLKEIEAQGNPRRRVEITAEKRLTLLDTTPSAISALMPCITCTDCLPVT
jgi:hypothetical protein